MTRHQPDLDDLERELRDHIDAETADNIARGMTPDAARTAALRKFGNITRIKEDVREVWVARWWEHLRQDVRDAARQVRRNPGFALAIAATLALGIGLTVAVFSVVNAVLLRPLSYPHPDRIVWLTTRDQESGQEIMNGLDFADWRGQATSFAHMVAYAFSDATVVSQGEPSRWRVQLVSEGFWELTGAHVIHGSLPSASDRQVIALSHRAFRERFQSDPSVIGRAVSIEGQQFTIGAVLAETFSPQFPAWAWRPGVERLEVDAYRGFVVPPAAPRSVNQPVAIYLALGEVKEGVSIDAARSELQAIQARIEKAHPSPFGASVPVVEPLSEKLVGPARVTLRILLAAAVCVLLVACANAANLLLSRSAVRQKEVALRMSVGSGPLRVLRQFFIESLLYALAGATGGLILASWLVDLTIALVGDGVPRLAESTLDLQVLAFVVAIAITTAVLFGAAPALALSRTNVQDTLKDGARAFSAPRRLTAGRIAVAIQVALTLVLLASAALMLNSVWRMTAYPPGFRPDEILTLRVEFSGPNYRGNMQARRAYAERLATRAASLPGVRQVAFTTARDSWTTFIKEGEPPPENPESHTYPVSAVSADWPHVVGMSLVRGRWIVDDDMRDAILINEALAAREYPGSDPVGRRIRVEDDRYGTIVGVVRDLKYARIDADPEPELFASYKDEALFGLTFMFRIDGDPMVAAETVTSALASIDPTQSLFEVRTLEHALADSIAPRRFNLLLLGTFAVVGLTLAALGIYGVIAYAVSMRAHEIGIRLALGAERQRVVQMIVRHGMTSVAIGIGFGVVGARWATQLVDSLLYGVESTDAPTFAAATTTLIAIAVAACVLPALRAAKIDPLQALRTE